MARAVGRTDLTARLFALSILNIDPPCATLTDGEVVSCPSAGAGRECTKKRGNGLKDREAPALLIEKVEGRGGAW